MAVMETIKKQPIWQQLYNKLRMEIPKFEFGQRFCTLADICRKYGVSEITARRVLSEMEKEGLVEKIQKRGTIVKNFNEVRQIRLVIPGPESPRETMAHPVALRIHTGITRETMPLKINVGIVSETYLQDSLPDIWEKVGFLIFEQLGESFLKFLKERRLPYVLLHIPSRKTGSASVRPDLKDGAYLATQYLISLGHRRIGLVFGPISDPYFLPRFKGYIKALKEAKIRFDWSLIKESSGNSSEEDEIAFQELMRLSCPPSAIFAGNDYRAIHLLEYCRGHNIHIPEDLSIVGYDNIADSSLVSPPLTTIDTYLEQLGAEGVKLLLNMMANKNPDKVKDIVIKPGLVIRESAGKWHKMRS